MPSVSEAPIAAVADGGSATSVPPWPLPGTGAPRRICSKRASSKPITVAPAPKTRRAPCGIGRPTAGDHLRVHAPRRLAILLRRFVVFVCCLVSASFAKRSARRRTVLAWTASLSASYSRIASAASRARSSFIAAIADPCWAFFNIVAICLTMSVCGCIAAVFVPPKQESPSRFDTMLSSP